MTGPLTVDASVFVRAACNKEEGHEECLKFVRRLGLSDRLVVLPCLVMPEVASGLRRQQVPEPAAEATLTRLRQMPALSLVPVDEALAEEAVRIIRETGLRGADAVYVAVARRFGTILVSAERQQRTRVPSDVVAMRPEEVE